MKYLLAIDAGTGSVRVVLFDLEGNQVAISQREWIHIPEDGVADSMSFDFEKNWLLTKQCIKDILSTSKVEPNSILAISATSMREGIVLYDRKQKELWGVANVDARASREVAYLKKEYKGIEEKFYKKSGQTFALGAIPRLLWLKNNNPEIYKKVNYISMIGDWVLAKLGGVIATDPSNGGTTGIFSLKKRVWANNMARKVGLKDDIFPPCHEVGTVISTVKEDIAKELGLSSKTLVVTGGGDVQLGSAGLGVVKKGDVAVLGGSFWQQVVNIPHKTKPPKDMSLRVNPHVVATLSQAEGIIFFSGLVMRWFRDAFCDMEKEIAQKRGIDTYTLLEEMAKDIPVGSYGIIPIFSDSMNYGKWYHASPSFLNLSLDSSVCNKASIFKSLQENACIVSKINLQKIEKWLDIKIKEIVFAGGASKGELWCQTLADVTGCKVKVPKVTEATALGTAMSAGIGAGVYRDFEEAVQKLVKWDREYLPNNHNTKLYRKIIKKWKKIYKVQLKLVDDGLTNPMWKAPGL